jgi:Putative DNA-binding domain
MSSINKTIQKKQRSRFFGWVMEQLAFGIKSYLIVFLITLIVSLCAWTIYDENLQKDENEVAGNQLAVVRAAVSLAIHSESYYAVTVNSIIDSLDHIFVIVYDEKLGKVSTSNLEVEGTLEQKHQSGAEYLQSHPQGWEELIPVEGEKTTDGKPQILARVYVYKRPFERGFWQRYWSSPIVASLLLAFGFKKFLQFLWELYGDKVRYRSDKLKVQISLEENQFAEFKPALRWNTEYGEERDLEHEAVKTICGFLNQDGGTLFVGVLDDGTVVGIEGDLKHFSNRQNPEDMLQQHCSNIVRNHIGKDLQYLVKIRYESIFTGDINDDLPKRILLVDCKPSPRPVLFKNCFYIRTGNRTDLLYDANSQHGQIKDKEDLKKVLLFSIDHFSRRGIISRVNYSTRRFLKRITIRQRCLVKQLSRYITAGFKFLFK